MTPKDFQIGMEFVSGDRRYRCTDIGTRTVIAIQVDQVTPVTVEGGKRTSRELDQQQAEAEGWFNGPPYPVAEIVFDEDDLEGCEPIARKGCSASQ